MYLSGAQRAVPFFMDAWNFEDTKKGGEMGHIESRIVARNVTEESGNPTDGIVTL